MSEEAVENVQIVSFTNEDGIEESYVLNMKIKHDEKLFCLLTPVQKVNDVFMPTDSPEVYVVRIDIADDGTNIYVDPTDEEFEQIMDVISQVINSEDEE